MLRLWELSVQLVNQYISITWLMLISVVVGKSNFSTSLTCNAIFFSCCDWLGYVDLVVMDTRIKSFYAIFRRFLYLRRGAISINAQTRTLPQSVNRFIRILRVFICHDWAQRVTHNLINDSWHPSHLFTFFMSFRTQKDPDRRIDSKSQSCNPVKSV